MIEIDQFFADELFPNGTEAQKTFLKILMALSRQGHLCMSVDDRILPNLSCLGYAKEETVHLEKLVFEGVRTLPPHLKWIKKVDQRWYLERNWKFENKFISHLQRVAQAKPKHEIAIEKIEGLEPEQQEGIDKALSYLVSIISGGPGTGKSYMASCLVKAILNQCHDNFRIVVAAPTGKAAAHLESKLPKDRRIRCGTLHQLLNIRRSEELNGERGYLGADLLIIDECSMIDVRLFAYLLASLEEGTRVVLMGDKDQLPPVDAGSLFADLADSSLKSLLGWTHLTKCLRSDRQEILKLAEAIKQGHFSGIELDEDLSFDLEEHFVGPSDLIPSFEKLFGFCILSCVRQGPWGVDQLNRSIADHFLSQAKKGQYFASPVIVTKNDYTLKLFNGQTGVLLRRIGYQEEDRLIFPDRTLQASMVSHFEYAYVMSVHKCQGSEYDHVLLLVPPGAEVFGREVLYTAVTRARFSVKIKGKKDTLLQALSRSSRKMSGLH